MDIYEYVIVVHMEPNDAPTFWSGRKFVPEYPDALTFHKGQQAAAKKEYKKALNKAAALAAFACILVYRYGYNDQSVLLPTSLWPDD
jgi:hypothetical protein